MVLLKLWVNGVVRNDEYLLVAPPFDTVVVSIVGVLDEKTFQLKETAVAPHFYVIAVAAKRAITRALRNWTIYNIDCLVPTGAILAPLVSSILNFARL